MSFPDEPAKFRPGKILFRIDVLREADRAVQEGLGGYANRHELVNDLVEQGLIDLRYPDDSLSALPDTTTHVGGELKPAINGGGGGGALTGAHAVEESAQAMPEFESLSDIGQTRIAAPEKTGATVENELGAPEPGPLFGMHNRDAPTAWALSRLAEEAMDGPVPLEAFYSEITKEAWALAAQLRAFETEGGSKLAVMLPRNPSKPQSAAIGFRAFALGSVARKPNEAGRLTTSGPFFQWNAVGLVGDLKEPKIGLTIGGWELVRIFDGLDFSIPHPEEIGEQFLAHLGKYALADLWGFQTALEGAASRNGRSQMNEYFRERLGDDYPDVEWKDSVADSVASGYVSRARAWGLIAPKLQDGEYTLIAAGERALSKLAAPSKA